MQVEIATALSDAGPALGFNTVGTRPPGAFRIAALQGPFAWPAAQETGSDVPQ